MDYKMGRKLSREAAMKMLYQLDLQKDDKDEQINYLFNNELDPNNFSDKDKLFIRDLIDGVEKNKVLIDEIISQSVKGWKLHRISKVDLAILRLCIYEIKFREDIPDNVSINEAVELAKTYSGEESRVFVNGVLGNAVKILKNEV